MTAGAAFAHDWIYGRNLCVTYAFAMALTGETDGRSKWAELIISNTVCSN